MNTIHPFEATEMRSPTGDHTGRIVPFLREGDWPEPTARGPLPAGEASHPGQIIAWGLRCTETTEDVTDPGESARPVTVELAHWRRAPSPAGHHLEAGWLYATDEAAADPSAVPDLEAAARDIWHRHVQTAEGLAELRHLTATLRRYQERRDHLARTLGAHGIPWSAIGKATGLTRQGARQRWAAQNPRKTP